LSRPEWPGKALGLWTRLNSHASGRRSGDQFNIYVCDRFVVPVLTPGQQRDIACGRLLLDQLSRSYIHEHLTYRFQVCPDGTAALAGERAIRAGGLPAGRPYLNPLGPPGMVSQPVGSPSANSGMIQIECPVMPNSGRCVLRIIMR
jgi:hypothetical protein